MILLYGVERVCAIEGGMERERGMISLIDHGKNDLTFEVSSFKNVYQKLLSLKSFRKEELDRFRSAERRGRVLKGQLRNVP